MSLTWIICGAGRNVGKTTVALRLSEILPESIYAKCGHSRAKPEKNDNFFNNIEKMKSFMETVSVSYKHIIVESNILAKSNQGDFVIFIDGIKGKTNFRDDTEQLRSAANIKICSDAILKDWKKVISSKISSKRICDSVCDLLLEQKRWLFGSNPIIRSKIWFESEGAHIFGNGLARLLENIEQSGTLQEAARASEMSYRYAWDLINMAERHFGKVLINRHKGGRKGGSSKLSSDGLRMLNIFKKLNAEVTTFTNEKFAELYTE